MIFWFVFAACTKEIYGKRMSWKICGVENGGQSWFVKVIYYPSIRGCQFSKGWIKFMKECKVEIGNTCLLERIDEKKYAFKVSIVG
jgi:hypothetical protein